MNHVHLLNIGYPKCGTTWLWTVLTMQSWFSAPVEKENTRLIMGSNNIAEYIDSYKNFNITANFSPDTFAMDRYLIQQLEAIGTTKVSIIFRNPYDLYWSLFNYTTGNAKTYTDFVNVLVTNKWFTAPDKILIRWRSVFDKVNVFFYDDIVSNPNKFVTEYCSNLSLPDPEVFFDLQVNVTTYRTNISQELPMHLRRYIDDSIDRLQLLVDRDILHWKR